MNGHTSSVKADDGNVFFYTGERCDQHSDLFPDYTYNQEDTIWYSNRKPSQSDFHVNNESSDGTWYVNSSWLKSHVNSEGKSVIDSATMGTGTHSFVDDICIFLDNMLGLADNTFLGRFFKNFESWLKILLYLLVFYLFYRVLRFFGIFGFVKKEWRRRHGRK